MDTGRQSSFYYNPYSGELSLEFPTASTSCRGGILADEMGLGVRQPVDRSKTVRCASAHVLFLLWL